MKAPAPETFVPKLRVRGPLPPTARSEVHTSLSPAAKPVPCQLQGAAAQATETILFAPVKEPVTASPFPDVALKPAASKVPSAPNCPQLTESLAACPAGLVTPTSESDQATAVANRIKKTALAILQT